MGWLASCGSAAAHVISSTSRLPWHVGAIDQATRAAQRSVELNPSFALGPLVLAVALVFPAISIRLS